MDPAIEFAWPVAIEDLLGNLIVKGYGTEGAAHIVLSVKSHPDILHSLFDPCFGHVAILALGIDIAPAYLICWAT